jgi:hypothetical protein
LAKFPKGKKNFQAIFFEENKNWGHFPPPRSLVALLQKKNPSMCNLVPFPLLIGYPRTKISEIKFPMEKNFVRLPKENIHPCAT